MQHHIVTHTHTHTHTHTTYMSQWTSRLHFPSDLQFAGYQPIHPERSIVVGIGKLLVQYVPEQDFVLDNLHVQISPLPHPFTFSPLLGVGRLACCRFFTYAFNIFQSSSVFISSWLYCKILFDILSPVILSGFSSSVWVSGSRWK